MQSVDHDQTPRSAASDLGLYCLPKSLLWDARLKWVKQVLHARNLTTVSDATPNYTHTFDPLMEYSASSVKHYSETHIIKTNAETKQREQRRSEARTQENHKQDHDGPGHWH